MTVTRFTTPQPNATKLVVLCSAAGGRVLQNIMLFFQQLLITTIVSTIEFHIWHSRSFNQGFPNKAFWENDCISNLNISRALLSSGCCCSLNLFNSAFERCQYHAIRPRWHEHMNDEQNPANGFLKKKHIGLMILLKWTAVPVDCFSNSTNASNVMSSMTLRTFSGRPTRIALGNGNVGKHYFRP